MARDFKTKRAGSPTEKCDGITNLIIKHASLGRKYGGEFTQGLDKFMKFLGQFQNAWYFGQGIAFVTLRDHAGLRNLVTMHPDRRLMEESMERQLQDRVHRLCGEDLSKAYVGYDLSRWGEIGCRNYLNAITELVDASLRRDKQLLRSSELFGLSGSLSPVC
jgi:hypothetical protein